MTRGGLLLLVAGLLTVVACSTMAGSVKMTEPVDRPGAWESVLKEHTLRAQLWYGLVYHSADIDCTLVTPRLRSAFIADRERFYGEIAQDLADDLQNMGKPPDEGFDAPMQKGPEAENEILIYAALWAADTDFRDLGTDYTAWTVELRRGGGKVVPTQIDQLRNNEALEAIMPHVDRFDNVYVMRFPLVDADNGTAMFSPGGDPLLLEIKSALGVARFEWTLKGGSGLDATAPAKKTSADPALEKPLPDSRPPPATEKRPPVTSPAEPAPEAGQPPGESDAFEQPTDTAEPAVDAPAEP